MQHLQCILDRHSLTRYSFPIQRSKNFLAYIIYPGSHISGIHSHFQIFLGFFRTVFRFSHSRYIIGQQYMPDNSSFFTPYSNNLYVINHRTLIARRKVCVAIYLVKIIFKLQRDFLSVFYLSLKSIVHIRTVKQVDRPYHRCPVSYTVHT